VVTGASVACSTIPIGNTIYNGEARRDPDAIEAVRTVLTDQFKEPDARVGLKDGRHHGDTQTIIPRDAAGDPAGEGHRAAGEARQRSCRLGRGRAEVDFGLIVRTAKGDRNGRV
jgi:hypothetical protein